jgi:alpha-glucosidase
MRFPAAVALSLRVLVFACAFPCAIAIAQTTGIPGVGFKPIELSTSGTIDDSVALFVPAGLDADHLPHSFSLLHAPHIQAPVPSTWLDRPVFTSDGPRFRATLTVGPNVDLYGGGEVTGPLRRNGTTIRLWNTDNYTYEKDNGHRLYQSHPWVLGVRPDGSSFGVIFDSTWKAELTCEDTITFTAIGPAFPVIVIERNSPDAVITELANLTGHINLPPLWALGYQQCRYSYDPASRVREIADNFRSRQIPCDVVWMDIDYMDAYRIFTFRKDEFPDPDGLNQYLHDRGFKSVWMIDPGVKIDPGYTIFDSGTKAEVWIKDFDGRTLEGKVWPGPVVYPDFTRPETRTWWANLYASFISRGVDGVWNDMNEPADFDTPDWTIPEDSVHRGGGEIAAGPHRRYHNVYGMLMASATREGILKAHPEKRPFVLTRANFLGGQRYAATWTGDNASREEHLEMSIPMSLTLGLSGQPFNGPDIGGFAENASAELWARWIGLGAFYPFSRGHAVKGSNNKEPWAFGPEVESTARIALDRRYRLLPYFYTLFQESTRDGLPVMRPDFFIDPHNRELRGEQGSFTLGSNLLIVPRWSGEPHLAKTDWREFSLVDGDEKDANQPSVRIRAGSIVPLGKVIQNTTENSLDPLTLVMSLDAQGQATGQLYEDDGDGWAYQKGNYLLTTYRATRRGDKVEVTVEHAEGQRPRPARTVAIEVVAPDGHVTHTAATGL